MFDFFTPIHPFGGQTLRLIAQAQQGGGDIFDIARTCARIETGDKNGWEREWLTLAQHIEAKAREALQVGRHLTAIQHFFHANQYYRMADVFLTGADEAKKREHFRKAQECFRAGAKLHEPAIEIIMVRCGAEEYEGYFCHPPRPRTGKWPAIFFIGGADSYSEEVYFAARPILER